MGETHIRQMWNETALCQGALCHNISRMHQRISSRALLHYRKHYQPSLRPRPCVSAVQRTCGRACLMLSLLQLPARLAVPAVVFSGGLTKIQLLTVFNHIECCEVGSANSLVLTPNPPSLVSCLQLCISALKGMSDSAAAATITGATRLLKPSKVCWLDAFALHKGLPFLRVARLDCLSTEPPVWFFPRCRCLSFTSVQALLRPFLKVPSKLPVIRFAA